MQENRGIIPQSVNSTPIEDDYTICDAIVHITIPKSFSLERMMDLIEALSNCNDFPSFDFYFDGEDDLRFKTNSDYVVNNEVSDVITNFCAEENGCNEIPIISIELY